MPYLKTMPGSHLYYEDRGAGSPVVLLAGFPMDGASWDKQTTALLGAGYRVLAYDRRGCGRSGPNEAGYSLDRWADDLHHLLTALDLRGCVLIGYSLGAAEAVRYFSRHGLDRVERAVFLAGPGVGLAANPGGFEPAYFDAMDATLAQDRFAFLEGFFQNCFNAGAGPEEISASALRAFVQVANATDPFALRACAAVLRQDFTGELPGLRLPCLLLHGDQDRIAPLPLTAQRAAPLLPQACLEVIAGAPHGLIWTHAEQVNRALLAFLAGAAEARPPQKR